MHFRCVSNRCILTSYVCDGTDDCYDNTDEEDCGNISLLRAEHENRWDSCADLYHPCVSGECIPLTQQCDGEYHCQDGSDELSCPTTGPYTSSMLERRSAIPMNVKVNAVYIEYF